MENSRIFFKGGIIIKWLPVFSMLADPKTLINISSHEEKSIRKRKKKFTEDIP